MRHDRNRQEVFPMTGCREQSICFLPNYKSGIGCLSEYCFHPLIPKLSGTTVIFSSYPCKSAVLRRGTPQLGESVWRYPNLENHPLQCPGIGYSDHCRNLVLCIHLYHELHSRHALSPVSSNGFCSLQHFFREIKKKMLVISASISGMKEAVCYKVYRAPSLSTRPTHCSTQTLMSFESSTSISFQYSLGKENEKPALISRAACSVSTPA